MSEPLPFAPWENRRELVGGLVRRAAPPNRTNPRRKVSRPHLLVVISSFLVVLLYVPTSSVYGYSGFTISKLSPNTTTIVLLICIVVVMTGAGIRRDLLYFAFVLCWFSMTLPAVTLYLFGAGTLFPCLVMVMPLVSIRIYDALPSTPPSSTATPHVLRADLANPGRSVNTTFSIILCLATLMVVPYLVRLPHVDWSNLLLSNVYETRATYETDASIYVGYTAFTLGRIVLPSLLVFFWHQGKRFQAALCILLIVIVYLVSGAVKSILLSAIPVFILSFGTSVSTKLRVCLSFLLVACAVAFFQVAFIPGESLALSLLRRFFFVPAQLLNQYTAYFDGSRLSPNSLSILAEYPRHGLQIWFGEVVLGSPGLIASTGVATELTVYLGILGAILSALIFPALFHFADRVHLSSRYYGLLFVFVYIYNTVFIETSLLTHGLLVLLILIWAVLPRASDAGEERGQARGQTTVESVGRHSTSSYLADLSLSRVGSAVSESSTAEADWQSRSRLILPVTPN